jgi:hypothetical protein
LLGEVNDGGSQRELNWYAMGSKPFDLIETISDLLRRIDEGRRTVIETQCISDNFQTAVANREKAIQRINELHLKLVPPDEPAQSEAKAELNRQVSEHGKLSREADDLWRQLTKANGFLGPFNDDVLLLLGRLPLKPEWDVYRRAVERLNVRSRGSWTDPPDNPALGTLGMRLQEMLDLAGGAQAGQAPGSHASRQGRGPKLEISRRRVELEDKLRSELATVHFELRQPTSLAELRKKFPDFQIWRRLSGPEQESLLNEAFKPKAYAKRLVLQEFGLTSEETLKKDRKKLRAAANQRTVR